MEAYSFYPTRHCIPAVFTSSLSLFRKQGDHLSPQLSLHSRPLALSGLCLSCNGNTQYKWSAEGSNNEVLELNEITTSTGASSPDLVVRPGVLMDGLNYTFTLNISQPALELWGTASVTLQPHHPPRGGVCTLAPDSGIHLLETVVTYNCSGWVDGDGEPAQLRYTLQVEACPDASQPCRLLTLYRGTQHSFGTLVPLGSPGLEGNLSVITALVLVDDGLGATVTALNRTLTVQLPEVQGFTGWLKNKSQSELWPLVQRGIPQEVIPYSIALTSHLNRLDSVSEEDLQDRMVIRENLTRALASLPVSSLQEAAQISAALAQCTAVPRELACTGCQDTVLKALGKMISVIAEQTEPGDVTSLDTGRNILQILGSSMAVAADPMTTSGPKSHRGYLGSSEAAVSAYGQAGELMRSLMRSRLRGEEALTLTAPRITAVGRRSDPADLLCTERSGPCQFYIPRGLSAQLRQEREELVQILLGIDGDSPLVPPAHPPISTALAAMEFATPQGRPVPVADLPPDRAIRVLLPSRFPSETGAACNLTLPARGSINFTVGDVRTDPHAGLFLTFSFSLLPGTGRESSGQVIIMVDSQPAPSLSQHALIRELNLSLSAESPAVEDTVFLTPLQNSSGQELHVNVSSVLHGGTVQASVCVFSSLCRYFSLEQRRWSSQGLSPLGGSSPRAAHCLTQHLTLFGASLFVHPDALVLLPPPEGPVRNVVAGIVCAVLLLIHLLIALISHKLDHLDSIRSGLVPLCGQSGRYQYQVLVKTGWARGSGTTAHVGISLYGLNKSGSRHLQREAAFQRNALDHFQVETDANLGEIWKIRIWHDNTGLDPAWFLQHVVVWDRQTDNMYFFLVEDWLSVENEKNDGMVEKEVLASCPQDLQQFSRVLRSQLVFGMFERHLWVSVWERPSHNNFTRAQRVTCCALLLHLYLAVGAVWYGAAGSKGTSGPVSVLLLLNAETVAVGMTVAVLVLPLHLLFCFLFRMTASSKVTVDESSPPSPVSQTVEMDVYLSHSEQASSYFLSLPGGLDSILDGVSHSSESIGSKQIDSALWNASKLGAERVDQWASCDSIFDLPELQGVAPLGHARLLKRKKALLQLRLGSPACSTDQPHSLSTPDLVQSNGLQHNPLTLSEEDLIQSIATGAAVASSSSSGRVTSDSGRYSPCDTATSNSQESSCSGWSELSQEEPPYRTGLYKSPSSLSVFTAASTFLPSPSPDILGTSSTTRIGVARSTPGWLLPSWVLGVTYLLAGLLLAASVALVGLYGSSFSSSVLLMWLISAVSAFLTSALLLEPLKVCLQALFLAVVVRPVDPEVQERLGQEAAVRRGAGELGGKVRPPCGYGLLHAKEEARKVRALRSLMKSCLVHMLFLLVVLLVNYQDSTQAMHGRLLHSAIKHSLLTAPPGVLNLSSLTQWAEAWQWMDSTLVPYLYQSPSLHLLGLPRIQRVQSQDGCGGNVTDSLGFGSALFAPVVPASSHAPSGEQRDLAHSSCSGRLLSWLWQRPQHEGASLGPDTVRLGNSSELTRQLLSGLRNTRWIDATTKAVYVDFTQYHRETALFVAVTVMLERSHADKVLTTVSIEPFHMSPSHSAPDLQIAMMVLLLVFALSFLGSELWAVVTEHGRGLRYGRQCLQLLVSVLSLATAVLRISFLYKSASCLSHHGSQPQTFTNFHSAALLARMSSQLSALLLTLLVLKMVGVLRFVRRWVVFGRVLLQAWRELCGVVLMLVLMLLVFSHTGSLLFSSSVEGFRTVGQASLTLASALRGRAVTQRLCERHPMLGPLYCLSVVGAGLWVLGRLCGAMLMRSYRAAQAEMYRPAMEPQDYEMVEFFIKRLKLWMGLSKTKEFRHKVKFEGMVSPPSRSSLGSQLSSLSVHSPVGPRLASAQSLGSEDSNLSESYDVQLYLDRLLPTVNNMLSQFDRVNQLTDDLHCIELKLQGAQSRIAQKQKQQDNTRRKAWRISASTPPPRASPPSSPLPPPSPPHQLPSLPSFLSCNPTIPCTRTIFSESTLPWHSPHLRKAAHPAVADTSVPVRRVSGADAVSRRIPGRRAWHSGSSHSADAAQRSPQAACGSIRARPWSEEGGRSMACDRAPVKRRAWHPEEPEIVGSTPGSTASQCCDF
ncbi:polycystin-1 isoform X2 [Anguilla anguilla]|uniref:polycystin-1 isoform X2 n=1 Tax=Anguilla anguilla TaxID=7936 RepID=UPI0015A887C3|nr:polycystin-1 isoform X2 [Anguilla anguilla]